MKANNLAFRTAPQSSIHTMSMIQRGAILDLAATRTLSKPFGVSHLMYAAVPNAFFEPSEKIKRIGE